MCSVWTVSVCHRVKFKALRLQGRQLQAAPCKVSRTGDFNDRFCSHFYVRTHRGSTNTSLLSVSVSSSVGWYLPPAEQPPASHCSELYKWVQDPHRVKTNILNQSLFCCQKINDWYSSQKGCDPFTSPLSAVNLESESWGARVLIQLSQCEQSL